MTMTDSARTTAIPRIAPYMMPTPSELPAPRVKWRPEPDRAALLIHDMQNYFLSSFTHRTPPVTDMLRNISRLRAVCAERGIPVIYTAQPGGQTSAHRGLLTDFWGPGLTSDGGDDEIIDELAPTGDDAVLTKWRYSAFQRTGLDDILRRHRRDQLIITGIYAHIGVPATACEAFMRDTQSFVVSDAVADFGPSDHRQALDWVARRCGVVVPTAEVFNDLSLVPEENHG